MPVVELDASHPRATVCGTCGRGWDDTVSTDVTPVPAGRCPFEEDHTSGESTQDVSHIVGGPLGVLQAFRSYMVRLDEYDEPIEVSDVLPYIEEIGSWAVALQNMAALVRRLDADAEIGSGPYKNRRIATCARANLEELGLLEADQ